MKKFEKSEIKEYVRDNLMWDCPCVVFKKDSKLYVSELRRDGSAKLRIVEIDEWINETNKEIERANNNTGEYAVTKALGDNNFKPEDILSDWRSEIIEQSLDKVSDEIERFE